MLNVFVLNIDVNLFLFSPHTVMFLSKFELYSSWIILTGLSNTINFLLDGLIYLSFLVHVLIFFLHCALETFFSSAESCVAYYVHSNLSIGHWAFSQASLWCNMQDVTCCGYYRHITGVIKYIFQAKTCMLKRAIFTLQMKLSHVCSTDVILSNTFQIWFRLIH